MKTVTIDGVAYQVVDAGDPGDGFHMANGHRGRYRLEVRQPLAEGAIRTAQSARIATDLLPFEALWQFLAEFSRRPTDVLVALFPQHKERIDDVALRLATQALEGQ